MRKTFSVLLAVLLVAVMVCGCGTKSTSKEKQDGVIDEKSNEGELIEDDEALEISGDVESIETSKDNPAELGQWVESSAYSVTDKLDHTVYLRVTDIVRGDEAQAIVDDYNNNDKNLKEFDTISDDKIEFCVMSYEVYFPEDFPESSITPNISFTIEGRDVGVIEGADGKLYSGFYSVYDITPELNSSIKPDSVIKGQAVYYMLKGVTNYTIVNTYSNTKIDMDKVKSSYIVGK